MIVTDTNRLPLIWQDYRGNVFGKLGPAGSELKFPDWKTADAWRIEQFGETPRHTCEGQNYGCSTKAEVRIWDPNGDWCTWRCFSCLVEVVKTLQADGSKAIIVTRILLD
jgi:hypothetical protein